MPSADPVLILQPTSPPALIAPITTPPVVIGVATGGGTLTGGGSAGEVAVWDGSTDLTGDAALLWDATNKSLSITGPGDAFSPVNATATAASGQAVTGTASAAGGIALYGQSTAATGAGVGVYAESDSAAGTALWAVGGDAGTLPVRVDQPSGATAHSAEGYVNNVLKWAIDATGAFLGIVRLGWRVGGTLIGTRAHLNLIAGTGITLTAVDQSGTDAVDVTIAATTSVPLTTKGDVLGYDTAAARIPVGSNGKVLTANSGTALGVDWETPTVFTPDFGSDGDIPFFTTYPNIGGDGNLAWNNGTKTLLANGDGDVLPVLISKANAAGGIGHSAEVAQVDGHPLQVLTPTAFTGNFLEWFINGVSQGAFPAAGGAYFTNAALSTSATGGFLGIPSCAGPPTGVPSGYPAGVIPMVWDSVGLKLYCYSGGAWLASGVFT